MKFYLVGGAVRDRLLGFPVRERDWVVVGATPEQMIAEGYKPVGKDFPVFLHPATHEEYALARTERKSAPGYRGFTIHADPAVSLKEDLSRRDLTINALAEDQDGTLIDYYGGRHDLKNNILRHVSPAFIEDPVRVLRVARFAARYHHLGFRVARETQRLMTEMVTRKEVDALVPERVWQELVKALGESTPSAFFTVLSHCGALAVIFPELELLRGIPQPARYHPEADAWLHTLMALDRAVCLSDETKVRFAVLTHDLGKGTTPPADWPRHQGHELRGVEQLHSLCQRLKSPKAYRELAQLVARYHCKCHRALEMRAASLLKLLQALDAFRRPQRFEQFLLACTADYQGRKGRQQQNYPQAERLRIARAAALQVDPAKLMALGMSGERLAAALRERRVQVIKQHV